MGTISRLYIYMYILLVIIGYYKIIYIYTLDNHKLLAIYGYESKPWHQDGTQSGEWM